eukprot:942384-Amphidinium_carterae.1
MPSNDVTNVRCALRARQENCAIQLNIDLAASLAYSKSRKDSPQKGDIRYLNFKRQKLGPPETHPKNKMPKN